MIKKTSVLVLGFIFFISIIAILLLFLKTNDQPNHQYNSFSRTIVPEAVYSSTTLDVKYNSYYIAGATDNHIYFGNVSAVRHLLAMDTNLADTQHVELLIRGLEGLQFRNVSVMIDSPYYYFADGTIPAIFKGSLENWKANRYSNDNIQFMEFIPISGTSSFVRKIPTGSKVITLGKKTNGPPYLQLAPDLLEKQIDGRFCTDGMIHYDRKLFQLVYVYYYRNQFICTDSSLNMLYRANTIDTVSQAKIKVAKIKSDNTFTMSAPPMTVNKKSSVSNGRLFINSNLLAKNEDKKAFESSSVIDVYDLKGGQYEMSFYIPKFNGYDIREFQVFDDLLIALYDHWVIKYQLNTDTFKVTRKVKGHNNL